VFGLLYFGYLGVGMFTTFVHNPQSDYEFPFEVPSTEVLLDVPVVLQRPALPNGCEITALTAVINFYGYDVKHTTMSDTYLPKQNFEYRNGERYGPNPYVAYIGNPREAKSGFFCYAPPIVEAANRYLSSINSTRRAIDISGTTWRQIIDYLDAGVPVVIWVTEDLEKIKPGFSWRLLSTGALFTAPGNLHAVVLTGHSGVDLHVMDPLHGERKFYMGDLFASYTALGSHAVIIK